MRREEILARMQELVDLARTESRSMTGEEQNEWDDLQRELDELDGQNQQSPQNNQRSQEPQAGTRNSMDDVQRALNAERERCKAIRALCRSFNMADDADSYIDEGNTVDQVRSAILEKLARNAAPVGARVAVDEEISSALRQ